MNRSGFLVAAFALAGLGACQNRVYKNLVGEYHIGERAQVGPMIYNIFETQYLLKIGDGPDARVPQNRFFVIRLSAVNGGGAKVDQSIPTFSLLDDAGAIYTELDNGAGVPQWLGFSRKVRPAESLTGDIVFDVAPKHYKLRIADDTDERYALVDLPLTFGESVPHLDTTPPTPR